MKTILRRINFRQYGVFFGFAVLVIIVSILAPGFLKVRNLMNLLRQYSIVGILSVGMTLIILTGKFDISVGFLCGCCGVVLAKCMTVFGLSVWIAVPITLLFGGAVGLLNGFLIAELKIPSMIATLAMGEILNGAVLLLTNGYPISISSNFLSAVGKNSLLGVPIPAIIFFTAVLVAYFVLTKTVFGRSIYAVGGNAEAARLSGIKVNKVIMTTFFINGLLVALTGIVLSSRVMTATATAGNGYELDAIASVVIGGTRVSGGEGSVLRTIVGVLFLGVLSNALNLLGINAHLQYLLKGAVIILAVGYDSFSRDMSER